MTKHFNFIMPECNRLFRRLCLCLICALFFTPTNAQKQAQLDSLFRTLNEKGAFNGNVLVAENGKPVYERSFGYARFESRQMNNKETMFELASVTKQFTAMAIMQLHQSGRLRYTDDIKRFFPRLRYRHITISHLLHHTSGIQEYLSWNEKQINTHRANNNHDILDALIKNAPPLNFKPGDQLNYSNTNYVLLALTVEQVSGLSFEAYMNRYIFRPLGMEHTRVYPQRTAEKKIENYAYGHIYDPLTDKMVLNDSIGGNDYQRYFDGVYGPAGISSTTEDLLKWDQALYTDKLVKRKEQLAAYKPFILNNGKPASLKDVPYGFGWLLEPRKSYIGRTYLHTGGYTGYVSIIVRYPDKNKSIILVTNIWNAVNIYRLAMAAEDILFQRPFTIPEIVPRQKSVPLSASQLKAIEGTYKITKNPQFSFKITIKANQAYAQFTGQANAEIYPSSETEFFYTLAPAKFKFVKDNKGQIVKLILSQNGLDTEALKD
jgi:CubicO group peptidase (beta-lactamase class C family)